MLHVEQIQQREADRQSGMLTAATLLAFFLILFFIKMNHPTPPQDAISGIMIDFGDNKDGLGDDNEHLAGGSSNEQTASASTPTPAQPTPTPTPKPVVSSTPTPSKTVTAQDPNAIAIAQQKKEEERIRKEQEAEQKRIADAIKKAEADRLKKEKEEAQAKAQVAAVFGKGKNGNGNGTGTSSGNGNGNGQGNTKPGGNQGATWGQPGGSPNGTGTGTNGSGPGSGDGMSYDLKGRTWRQKPLVFDNTQKTGNVVVAIKVDKNGTVVYAKYQQKGSTTTDSYLIQISEQAALKSKFSADPGAEEEQFGTITFKYRVQ